MEYQTRLAPSFSAIWGECPYKGGYDKSIGTSERGDMNVTDSDYSNPPFKHLLIVFGGLCGTH